MDNGQWIMDIRCLFMMNYGQWVNDDEKWQLDIEKWKIEYAC